MHCPAGRAEGGGVHGISLLPRWQAHFCVTSTSKRPVFLWGCGFGCKCKCRSRPVLRGTPQILKRWVPCELSGTVRKIQVILPPETRRVVHHLCPLAVRRLAAPAHGTLLDSSRSTEVVYTTIISLL